MPRQSREKSGTGIYQMIIRTVPLIDDAMGKKLSVVYNVGSSGYTYYYSGNCIYRNGTLEKILVDGGYITLSGTTPTYHYYLQDHLGNNRVVCNASGTIKQVNHYYPFGGLFGESTGGSTQVYKYNGKEFDRINGLDWYDYGARHMSPDIGRFTTIDPKAEKYYNMSPYAYCTNNPINAIEPNGEEEYEINYDGYIIERNTFLRKILSFFGIKDKYDRVYIGDSDNPIISYPQGTINIKENSKSCTAIEIKKDQDAELFFQTIINNTDVEWAKIRHSSNGNTSNTIINEHDDNEVSSSVRIMESYTKEGQQISLFDHSHPLEKDFKYNGMPNIPLLYPPSDYDIKMAAKHPNTLMRVYDIYNKKIYSYDSNGIKKIYKR